MNIKCTFLGKIYLILLLTIAMISPGFAQFGGIGGRSGFNQRSAARMQQGYKDGRENGRQMKGYLGYEIGAFFSFADRNYLHVFNDIDVNGYNKGEASIKLKLKSRLLGFSAGSYTLLGKLGQNSALAFDWGVAAVFSSSNTGDVIMPSGNKYLYSINYLQLAVPLLLDYKFGGEASYDKSQACSITLGAGLHPAFSVVILGSSSTTKATIAPMVKGEIGFFAGLQWKIKASYIYRSGNIYRAEAGSSGLEGAPAGSVYTITSTAPFNLGISFMPFSYDWESSRW